MSAASPAMTPLPTTASSTTSSPSATLRTRRRAPSSASLAGRDRSPIPAALPHRAAGVAASSSSTSSSSLWNGVNSQWTNLQSIASSVLNSDESSDSYAAAKPRSSGNAGSWFSDLLTIPPPPPSSGRGDIYPRSRRRPTLSNSNGSIHYSPSTAESRRRQKRIDTSPSPTRTSFEDGIGGGADEDSTETLVYVIPIKPSTTLEGVVISLDTSVAAVRRANGLWPGDSLLSRRELLVPVDGCGVKGIPVNVLEAQDKKFQAEEQTDGAEEAETDEKPYHPVSTVSFPNSNLGEVIIARLPLCKLSYFPPRRRVTNRMPSTPRNVADITTPPDSPSPFPGVAPGVHSLQAPEQAHPQTAEGFSRTIGEIARETYAGMGVVGGQLEGFVRSLKKKAVLAKEEAGRDRLLRGGIELRSREELRRAGQEEEERGNKVVGAGMNGSSRDREDTRRRATTGRRPRSGAGRRREGDRERDKDV